MSKHTIDDLAAFGGPKLFDQPISTSNLVRPDVEGFLGLLKNAQTEEGEKALLRRLESELAEFHHTPHCIAVSNGFWALVLAIQALALPGRREVVMPSLTYRRLADVVAWAGLVPRFCDIDPATLAISPATALPHINKHTALIIGVHPIVNCCDASGLEALAQQHKIPLLFDAVESVYETHQGRKVGSFGDAEVFSCHASKLINGFEGGYITTRNPALAATLAQLRQAGNGGMQCTLPPAHAAMALQSLNQIEEQVAHNRSIYRAYQEALAKTPGLQLLAFNEAQRTSYKNIVVKLNYDWPMPRDYTVQLLNAEGVLARAYYNPPLHLKSTDYPTIKTPLPLTERAAQQYMLLPCGYQFDHSQVATVVGLLKFISTHADQLLHHTEAMAS